MDLRFRLQVLFQEFKMKVENSTPLKILLGLLALFIVIWLVWPKSSSPLEQDRERYLTRINSFRSEYARIAHIGNMNELVYDTSMEKDIEIVRTMACTESFHFHGKFPFHYLTSPKIEEAFLQYAEKNKDNERRMLSHFGVEDYFGIVLMPQFEKVACVDIVHGCSIEATPAFRNFIEIENFPMNAFCILSPRPEPSPIRSRTLGQSCAKGFSKAGNLCRRIE